MKHKITLLLFAFSYILFAQDTAYNWAKTVGGSGGYDFALSIDYDSTGNVYTAGYFSNTVDFDPSSSSSFTLSSNGSSDMFIQKLDANGNFVWAVSFGSSFSDVASDIVIDANDNVIITGFFRGTVDFDPSSNVSELVSGDYYQNYVLKLDADGNLVWAKAFGRTSFSNDYGSVDVDATGNVYTTSYFRDTADFDPGSGTFNVTSSGFSDIYVHKLDVNGNFSWVRTFGSSNSHDIGHALVVSNSGYVYSTGEFLSTVDFNTGSGTYNRSSNGIRDYYIHKLDTNGNFIWARTAGGSSDEIGRGIALDSNENIYFVGYVADSGDFDPTSSTYNVTVTGAYNAFIAKFNSSGNFQWAKNIDGVNVRSDATDIAIDVDDKVYFIGSFQFTPDFDFSNTTNTMTSNGNDDIFVQKIDGDSNFIWAKSIGGSSWDIPYGIKIGPQNQIYIAGTFTGSVDFDFTTNTDNQNRGSGYNIFTSKWKDPEVLSVNTFENQQSYIFPNPAKERINLSFQKNIQEVDITLFTVSGELLFKKKFQHIEKVTLPLQNISRGIYFLNVTGNSITETHKLIIN
ncbi:T9SS type A sorting domain-containing protein [Kordia sp.]|uniref:T9SS type A sorting domain-containing protein n=1 Tax=Kordia sp. TaxID=1965332 RepID=UPI003D27F650